jgi:hypothetical protein
VVESKIAVQVRDRAITWKASPYSQIAHWGQLAGRDALPRVRADPQFGLTWFIGSRSTDHARARLRSGPLAPDPGYKQETQPKHGERQRTRLRDERHGVGLDRFETGVAELLLGFEHHCAAH